MTKTNSISARGVFQDLSSQRFTRLTVIRYHSSKNQRALWECRCDCGNIVYASTSNLRKKSGTKSCGCYRLEKHTIHGQSNSPTFKSWWSMRNRCSLPNLKEYKNYGGRGITVCDRWANSFKNFLDDMGERPALEYSLDRIDNNGNYEPNNCRWATRAEQGNNKRTTRKVYYEGAYFTIAELSSKFNISTSVLGARVALGWPIDKVVTTPVAKRRKKG